jgi:hypothetical protein
LNCDFFKLLNIYKTMKKLILSFLFTSLSAFVFGQSVSITPNQYINTTQTVNDNMKLVQYGNTSAGYELTFSKARGTVATPTAILNGDNLMFMAGLGYNGSTFATNKFAFLATATENWTTTANGTQFSLRTTQNGTTSATARFLIANDGKIAIGSHTPLTKLHIRDAGASGVTPNSNASVFIDDNTNNYLGLASPDANETGILFGKPTLGAASGGIIYDNTNHLLFRTGGNNTRMSILSNGRVGIGTTTPDTKFVIHESAASTSTRLRLTNATTGNTATDGAYIEAESGGELTIGNRENSDMDFVTNDAIQFTIKNDGKVGIGSQSPTAKLHVEGDLALSKITTNTVNGGYNDLNRNGASILRFTNGGDLFGIAGGSDGMILFVFNTGLSSLVIHHQHTGSVAANRIITHNNNDLNLGAIGGVTMVYDGTSSRWRIVSVGN